MINVKKFTIGVFLLTGAFVIYTWKEMESIVKNKKQYV